ncbi:MAG: CopG family antitoxin [Bacteriovorax sp.]|jgi:predicted DNA binding CopG/RHH family protein
MKKNYNLKELKKRPGKVKVDPEATRIMISLKLDANNLADLKSEAERLGMPYQTLINSILHRYVSGELVDKRDLRILKLG